MYSHVPVRVLSGSILLPNTGSTAHKRSIMLQCVARIAGLPDEFNTFLVPPQQRA